jgi:ABC-type sugar transport systems, permease components
MTFTGLSNYTTMFADPLWQKSLVNTLLLVVGLRSHYWYSYAHIVAAMTLREESNIQDPSSR